jgi:aspartyl-tRNA(Asn)/glutamyl-tRNA(Gln) amidotransferase subunit A
VPDYVAALGQGVVGLRIGIIRHFHETDHRASPATIAGIDGAADILSKLGATVTDITLSPLVEYQACGSVIMLAEAYALHEPWLTTRFHEYGELFRDRVALAAFFRAADYLQAIRRRRELCQEMAAAMADVDVVITAAQPGEAALITEVPKWAMLEKPGFTFPFNITGYPAMSVCTGYGAGGLPVSMQIAAKPFCEPTLFRVAHAYEEATAWRELRPAMTLHPTSGVAS